MLKNTAYVHPYITEDAGGWKGKFIFINWIFGYDITAFPVPDDFDITTVDGIVDCIRGYIYYSGDYGFQDKLVEAYDDDEGNLLIAWNCNHPSWFTTKASVDFPDGWEQRYLQMQIEEEQREQDKADEYYARQFEENPWVKNPPRDAEW